MSKLLTKILGNDKKFFNEIQVKQDLIDTIINAAENSHPNEFSALLTGEIKNNILLITNLMIVPSIASNEGATMNILMAPEFIESLGSVHSHPGTSARPSQADLQFFSKTGLFHMIIAEPYTQNTIKSYTRHGDPVHYRIIP